MCTLRCFFKCVSFPNVLLQCSHLCPASSKKCFLVWTVSSFVVVNDLGHLSQQFGPVHMWLWICSLSATKNSNGRWQMLQSYETPLLWVLMWSFKFLISSKAFPHTMQVRSSPTYIPLRGAWQSEYIDILLVLQNCNRFGKWECFYKSVEKVYSGQW